MRGAWRRFVYLVAIQGGLTLTGIGLWWGISVGSVVPEIALPPPADVWKEFLSSPGWYLEAAVQTLLSAAAAYALVIMGTLGGAVLGCLDSKLVRLPIGLAVGLQAIPIIAVAPILGLLVGVASVFEISVAFLVAFFPVFLVAAKNSLAVPDYVYIDADFKEGRRRVYRMVAGLRHLKGTLLAVVRGGSPLAVVGAVVAEYVGMNSGTGFVVYYGAITSDSEQMYCGAALASVAGFVFYGLVDCICHALLPVGREL